MATFELPNGNIEANELANPVKIDENFAAIESILDQGLDDQNISPSANIDARKIGNGGAVTQGEVTTTGEASKIPKYDANGNLVVSRIVFKEA